MPFFMATLATVISLLGSCYIFCQMLGDALILKQARGAASLGHQASVAIGGGIELMNTYVAQNLASWYLGAFPMGYEQASGISLEALDRSLKAMEQQGPYESEAELRQALNGLSFKTPFVGIYVLQEVSGAAEITQFFRAPGPDMAESPWEQMTIQK
jgi:hypothetical protein